MKIACINAYIFHFIRALHSTFYLSIYLQEFPEKSTFRLHNLEKKYDTMSLAELMALEGFSENVRFNPMRTHFHSRTRIHVYANTNTCLVLGLLCRRSRTNPPIHNIHTNAQSHSDRHTFDMYKAMYFVSLWYKN